MPRSRPRSPDGGLLVACHDDPGSLGRSPSGSAPTGRRVLTYGTDPAADLVVESTGPTASAVGRPGPGRRAASSSTSASPGAQRPQRVRGLPRGDRRARLWTAAAVLAGLAAFTGARRRFEAMGEAGGVSVVDDYAHNPAKVAAVVATARDVLGRRGSGRLHVVFQPHLYSRTRDFADGVRRRPRPGRHRASCSTSTALARTRCRASPPSSSPRRCATATGMPRPASVGLDEAVAVRRRAGRARRPRPHRRRRRRDDARPADPRSPGGVVSGIGRPRPRAGSAPRPAPPGSRLLALPLRGPGDPGPPPPVARGAARRSSSRARSWAWPGWSGGARSLAVRAVAVAGRDRSGGAGRRGPRRGARRDAAGPGRHRRGRGPDPVEGDDRRGVGPALVAAHADRPCRPADPGDHREEPSGST